MRHALALLIAAALAADPASVRAGPAEAALEVFRKHCVECHGNGPRPRASLDVLDTDLLVRRRRVVLPRRPRESELLVLMESGAMPPGDRPKVTRQELDTVQRWIEAGAGPLDEPPRTGTGEAFVLTALARDWERLPPDRRPVTRYVSLNHLLNAANGRARLQAARKELERVAAAFAAPGGKGPRLEPIDGQQASVFRLDLKELGWDRQRFVLADSKPARRSPLTVFDLVLLEYPYAVLPFGTPEMDRALPVLRQMGGVRPVPYVRGDWLAAVLTNRTLGAELLALAGRTEKVPPAPPAAVWPAVVTHERAVLELGWKGDPGRLKRALDEVRLADLPLGRAVTRAFWELRYPLLVRKLGLGTPIVPLDGTTALGAAGTDGMRVTVATYNGERKAAARVFYRGEYLQPRVTPDRAAVFRVLHSDAHGVREELVARATSPAGKPWVDPGDRDSGGRGYKLSDEAVKGENEVTVLALPTGAGELPPVVMHQPEKMPARVGYRVVHPFYRLREDGKGLEGLDAGRVSKMTVRYQYLGPKG